VKRQRCCTGTARGVSLSLLYDFFILTHEYLAVFRRPISGAPAANACPACDPAAAVAHAAPPAALDTPPLVLARSSHAVPLVPLAARGRVLGTVWCFHANDVAGLHRLATAQMVRRPRRGVGAGAGQRRGCCSGCCSVCVCVGVGVWRAAGALCRRRDTLRGWRVDAAAGCSHGAHCGAPSLNSARGVAGARNRCHAG
jgi:hypothetical protein